jgi:phospholipase/carboxylesterase
MAELRGPEDLPRGPVGRAVVLLHGVGADGSDLIGLAPALRRWLPDAAFHAPDAPWPCDMAPYGRQWFSLQDRRPAALLAGLRRAAPLLDAFLDALLHRHGLPAARVALLGFSQGTMLALHVAPRRAATLGAVLGFSGALVGDEELQAEARTRPPVMLIHGDADDIIPVGAMPRAVEGLTRAGIPVQWIVRPGLPHGIDEEGIKAGGRFLRLCLAG